MSLRQRLIKGSLWNTLSTCFSKGALFISAYITANILGAEQNGIWSMLQTSFIMLITVISLGLPVAITKYVAQWRSQDPNIVGKLWKFSESIITLLAAVSSFLILLRNSIFSPIHVSIINCVWILLIVYLTAITTVIQALITGLEEYKHLFITNLVQGICLLVFQTIGVILFGVDGILYGLLIALLISYIQLRSIISSHPITTYPSKTQINSLLRMSIPILLNGIFYSWICVWINQNLMLCKSDALGAWNAFQKIFNVIPVAVSTLMAPLLPIISHSTLTAMQTRKLMQHLFCVISIGALLLLTLTHFHAQVVTLLFSHSYGSYSSLFIPACLLACISILSLPVSFILQANAIVWPSVLLYFSVSLIIPFIPQLQINNYCYILPLITFINAVNCYLLAQKKGYIPNKTHFLPALLSITIPLIVIQTNYFFPTILILLALWLVQLKRYICLHLA
jgi:O-antigen/teichoic acid export membrane protein